MFKHAQKRKEQEMRFMAAIHGIDIDKVKAEKKEEDSFLFRDPKEYEHLSTEEKKKLTEEMLGKHQVWAGHESPLNKSSKIREGLNK